MAVITTVPESFELTPENPTIDIEFDITGVPVVQPQNVDVRIDFTGEGGGTVLVDGQYQPASNPPDVAAHLASSRPGVTVEVLEFNEDVDDPTHYFGTVRVSA